MNDPARPTTRHERDRALERLHSITTGAAIAATIASAGFGALAAVTWAGDSTTAANGTAANDGGAAGATVSQLDDTPIGGGSLFGPSSGDSSSAAATAVPLQPTTAPITASKKQSRVSSGGSR